MGKAKQLTVWLESAPGQIGRIARALGAAKVNITAFACHSATGPSPLRLQVSQHAKALKILQDLGLRVTEEEVLRVTVADQPGRLAEIGARLGQAGINIEYGYGAVAPKTRKADLVFSVSDPEGAVRALKGLK
ncbi:MAG TPA: ACT domain-containing protein [Terriglobia bacterium]|nr:ACT domain-containing protein [Terriglobia bacterium]